MLKRNFLDHLKIALVSRILQLRIQEAEMFNELFTTPCSPIFAGITVGFNGFIKPTQHILKPIGKEIGDNLTVRIEMECRH